MKFGVYEWVYILTSLFGMYILYRFMSVFFDTRRTSARFEFLSYLACTMIVNGVYLLVNIPIITMTANLTAFFLLSFNYEATVKKRLLSAVLIYIILMIVEMIVVLISGYFNFSLFTTGNYSSVIGIITSNIISFLVVLILNNCKNIKKGESVPILYWLCIFLVPSGSLYTILILFKARGLTASQVLAALIFIFVINIGTFHLYDDICRCFAGKGSKSVKRQRRKATKGITGQI